jgi:hypothetical protein
MRKAPQSAQSLIGSTHLKQDAMRDSRLTLSVQLIVYTVFALVIYRLFLQQALGLFPSDVPQHLSIINEYVYGHYLIPHPAFHLLVYWMARIAHTAYADIAALVMTTRC